MVAGGSLDDKDKELKIDTAPITIKYFKVRVMPKSWLSFLGSSLLELEPLGAIDASA